MWSWSVWVRWRESGRGRLGVSFAGPAGDAAELDGVGEAVPGAAVDVCGGKLEWEGVSIASG